MWLQVQFYAICTTLQDHMSHLEGKTEVAYLKGTMCLQDHEWLQLHHLWWQTDDKLALT